MIVHGEMLKVAAQFVDLSMEQEGWDNEPVFVALYGVGDDSNGTVMGVEFPGFNHAIETMGLAHALRHGEQWLRNPANANERRKIVRAHDEVPFFAVAVGMEGITPTIDAKDARTVLALDTAGRVSVHLRVKGDEPVCDLIEPPDPYIKVGGQLLVVMRDIMLSLCTELPEDEADIVAVSAVVRHDVPDQAFGIRRG